MVENFFLNYKFPLSCQSEVRLAGLPFMLESRNHEYTLRKHCFKEHLLSESCRVLTSWEVNNTVEIVPVCTHGSMLRSRRRA